MRLRFGQFAQIGTIASSTTGSPNCSIPRPWNCSLTMSMSDAASDNQSAGFLESVFRGKANSLVQDGSEKIIPDAALLREPFRRDGHERE